MIVPLYILGLLQRFGPQHGYQIKKIIAEQLSDFTQIKLPTIYYHLEKMKGDGLLLASSEKPGSRPEKTIYSITEKGSSAFLQLLNELLDFEYRPSFPSDAVFYFYDSLKEERIRAHLETYIHTLKKALAAIQMHKKETLQFIPHEMQTMAKIIFRHHEHHYQAELDWAIESFHHLNIKEDSPC